MTAAAQILATAAAIIWLASPAYVAGLWCRLKLDAREEAKRRVEQGREVTAEWLAVLAATDTPIFAEVWAESLRRDLEEWSA